MSLFQLLLFFFFSRETTKICRSSYLLEGAIALSAETHHAAGWIHEGEAAATASVHEAFSKHQHRASQPKSCSDPSDFLSPSATGLPTSARMDGFVSVSSQLPHCSRRLWGGSDISTPVMKSSWHCSSPLGIPIRNANDLEGE